eukprot:TRINITY_DN32060_c0_g1_i1.p1 TRINITY_DN32060_c0_g1~~TRINITY_DN32060_c0_g1_i1.p1  ORF type:complete len:591 (+),score=24.61 TRINITY_DN32060_c0_g1_i1:55-1773(+)
MVLRQSERHAIVARDQLLNRSLSFDELLCRVRRNKIDNVVIHLNTLTTEQIRQLVLRACHAGTVLAGFGHHLESIETDNASFGLSHPVDQIDEFISHTWSTRRLTKTIALLFHFNFASATLTYVIGVGVAFACCAAWRGCVEEESRHGFRVVSAFGMLFLPFFAYLLVFCFGVKLRFVRNANLFLDKLCIHQGNHDLKALGVNSLELFIRRSSKFVLLYDSCTFSRLWCTFEVAIFAHDRNRSMEDICIIPISTVIFVLIKQAGLMLVLAVAALVLAPVPGDQMTMYFKSCANEFLIARINYSWALPIPLVHCTVAPSFLLLGYLIRKRSDDLQQAGSILANFEVAEASCRDQGDRARLFDRIRSAWGDLQSFNAFVRNDLQSALRKLMGTVKMIPLPQLWAVGAPVSAFVLWVGVNSSSSSMTAYLIGALSMGFVDHPLCGAVHARIGFLVCSVWPQRPNLCTAVIGVCCFVSNSVHAYVNNCFFWLSFFTAKHRGWNAFGGMVIFGPWLVCQCVFLHLIGRAPRNGYIELEKWNAVDTFYCGFKLILLVGFYVSFNAMEAITGKQQWLCA